jgi:hypothetical protein
MRIKYCQRNVKRRFHLHFVGLEGRNTSKWSCKRGCESVAEFNRLKIGRHDGNLSAR